MREWQRARDYDALSRSMAQQRAAAKLELRVR
jgi:hypothetical protein